MSQATGAMFILQGDVMIYHLTPQECGLVKEIVGKDVILRSAYPFCIKDSEVQKCDWVFPASYGLARIFICGQIRIHAANILKLFQIERFTVIKMQICRIIYYLCTKMLQ